MYDDAWQTEAGRLLWRMHTDGTAQARVDDVVNLFCSSGGAWGLRGQWCDHATMLFWLADDFLDWETVEIPTVPEPVMWSSGRESAAHFHLKQSTLAWLLEQHADAREEVWSAGNRHDVASDAGRIFVECGDTNPQTFIDLLAGDFWLAGLLVPFQDRAVPTLIGLRLTMTDAGRSEYAEFWDRSGFLQDCADAMDRAVGHILHPNND